MILKLRVYVNVTSSLEYVSNS